MANPRTIPGLRLGVFGAGGMGRLLIEQCESVERARVVAVFDPVAPAAAAVADAHGARACSSAEELIDMCDAVIVASPLAAHLAQVELACRSGRPVFCEKPLAPSVADCDAAIRAADEAGTVLFVGHVLRFLPGFRETKELVSSGRLGAPRAVSITRAGPFSSAFSGWRGTFAGSGGMLMELHIHDLDHIRWIGGEVTSVHAAGGVITGTTDFDDRNVVVLGLDDGVVGLLDASMASYIHEYRVLVQCTGGTVLHDVASRRVSWRDASGAEETWTYEAEDVTSAYGSEMRAFVDCVLDGTAPAISGADGRAAVAIARAAYESVSRGAPVELSEFQDGQA